MISTIKQDFTRRIHPSEKLVLGITGLSISAPALLLSLLLAGPLIDGELRLLPCFTKMLTGSECWGCGMTRSFGAMWKANASLASTFNRCGPAGYVATWVLLFAGVGLVLDSRCKCSSRRNL